MRTEIVDRETVNIAAGRRCRITRADDLARAGTYLGYLPGGWVLTVDTIEPLPEVTR